MASLTMTDGFKKGNQNKIQYKNRNTQGGKSKSQKRKARRRALRAARSGRPVGNPANRLPMVPAGSIPNPLKAGMMAAVSSAQADLKADLAMLLNPKDNKACRLPDTSCANTALYCSIQEFSVDVDFGSVGSDQGRFSCCVQPKIGGLLNVKNYKCALSAFNDYQTADWLASATYESNVGNTDPRIDDNANLLFANSTGVWSGLWANTADGDPFFSSTFSVSPYNKGIDLDWGFDAATDESWFRLPLGLYYAQLEFDCVGAGVTVNTTTNIVATLGGSVTAFVPGSSNQALSSTGNDFRTMTALINVTDANNRFSVTGSYVGGTTSATRLYVMPVSAQGISSAAAGLVKKIRPVAMSGLFTYTGPLLTNGGIVAAARVAGEALNSNFFTNNPPIGGGFQMWESLSRVQRSYNGPIKDGAYAWYAPDNALDFQFRTPQESLDYQYPALVFSGCYQPDSTFTGVKTVGRLEVITVFEYTTTSTLVETKVRKGTTAELDHYLNLSSDFPPAMQNGKHWDAIKRFLGGAAKVAWDNRKAIAGALLPLL